MQRCTAPTGSLGSSLSRQKSTRWGFCSARATYRAWSMSSSMPSFRAAEMGTTGIPRISSSSLIRTEPPLDRTSSIMFRARTMGISSSINCMVK